MKAVITSRCSMNIGFDRILESLPLADLDFTVLNVYPRHRQRPGLERVAGHKGVRTDLSVVAEPTTVLSAACPEVLAKTGNFIKETMRVVNLHKPELVVLTQEVNQAGSLACLAHDGLRIFNQSKTSVLLLSMVATASHSRRVVVGAPALDSNSDLSAANVSSIMNPTEAEIIVAVVANPFYPPLSRVVPNMRGCQSRALREIHDEQAVEATAQAAMMADQLARTKVKPLYVGRTGRLVSELSQIVRSNDTSLLCLLVDSSSRKWLNRSKLLEMLENVDVPILVVPAGR